MRYSTDQKTALTLHILFCYSLQCIVLEIPVRIRNSDVSTTPFMHP